MADPEKERLMLSHIKELLQIKYPKFSVVQVNNESTLPLLHIFTSVMMGSEVHECLPDFHVIIQRVKEDLLGEVRLRLRLYTFHGKKLVEEYFPFPQFEKGVVGIELLDDLYSGRLNLCHGVQDPKVVAVEKFLSSMKTPLVDRVKSLFLIEFLNNKTILRSRLCSYLVFDSIPENNPDATDFVRCSECEVFSTKRTLNFFTFLKKFHDADIKEFDDVPIGEDSVGDLDQEDISNFNNVHGEANEVEEKFVRNLNAFKLMSAMGMFRKACDQDEESCTPNGESAIQDRATLNVDDDFEGLFDDMDNVGVDSHGVRSRSEVTTGETLEESNKQSVLRSIQAGSLAELKCRARSQIQRSSRISVHDQAAEVLETVKVEVKQEIDTDVIRDTEEFLSFMNRDQTDDDADEDIGLEKIEDKEMVINETEKRAKKREYNKKKRESDRAKGIKPRWYPKTYRKPCPICLHHYSAPSLIAKCVARHEEELKLDEPVRCPLCYLELESKRLVTKHFSDSHEESGKTCCCECLLIIPKENNRLRRHFIKRHHSAGKPEVCQLCGKTLPTARELKIHLEDHTNNGAICPTCGKVFPSRKLMVHHIGRHHRRRDLKCPYCEKLFVNRQQARKHMAMHTGLKPYKCPECKYAAYQTTNVHTHVSKTHGRKANNASIIIDEEECEKMNQMIKVDVDRMFEMRKEADC